MPQVQIFFASDELLDSADKFSALGTKLQSRISEAQSKGKDMSTLQTAYTDFQAKVTDAQTQANNAISTVTPLQPQDYPGNKTTLQSARIMLQTARQDLKTARQDAQTITQGLRASEETGRNTKSLRKGTIYPQQTITPAQY
jgi:chromosome segregation ATPase